ncbi:hypothetical protein CFP56_026204 [Quercus suber]|uniref:Uncharacterized protein n=1 Tax=Quercus suber TaxID=58331 RepID=A0AAW0K0L0_QUESU
MVTEEFRPSAVVYYHEGFLLEELGRLEDLEDIRITIHSAIGAEAILNFGYVVKEEAPDTIPYKRGFTISPNDCFHSLLELFTWSKQHLLKSPALSLLERDPSKPLQKAN